VVFWASKRGEPLAEPPGENGIQQITITVDGGYEAKAESGAAGHHARLALSEPTFDPASDLAILERRSSVVLVLLRLIQTRVYRVSFSHRQGRQDRRE